MHLLFDLDGTLTDPFPGITGSIRHALRELGREAPPAETLAWCIGPPLKKSFETLLGPEHAHLADAALVKYRERFSVTGLFENRVYPGIVDALDRLTEEGHTLSIATSKPTIFATRIVEHFGLGRYFRVVDGSEPDGTRADKGSLIAHVLQREWLDPRATLMIGDREHDILGANANGLAGIGVLWGYGGRMELLGAGAAALVAAPHELDDIVREVGSRDFRPQRAVRPA